MTASHQETVGPQGTSTLVRIFTRLNRRHVIVAGLSLVFILVLAIALLIGRQLAFSGRIYPGVRIQGVNIGAMTPPEAQSALESRLKLTSESTLTLTYGSQTFNRKLSELGIGFDAAATAQQAMSFGRRGSIFQQLAEQISTLFGSPEIAPVSSFDQADLEQFIQETAATINTPAIEASLKTSASDIAITSSASGRKVDVNKTFALCLQTIDSGDPNTATLVVEEIKPAIREADLQEARVTAGKIISAPIELMIKDHTWTITPEELATMVTLTQVKEQDMRAKHWDATLNQAELRKRLSLFTKDIDVIPIDAKIIRNAALFDVLPSSNGLVVDADSAITEVTKAAINGNRRVTLQIVGVEPKFRETQLGEAATLANQMAGAPMELKYGDKTWILSREELAAMIMFTSPTGANPAKPYFDEKAVTERMASIAAEINQLPQDAQTQMINNTPRLAVESKEGLTLDIPDAVAAINDRALSLDRMISLKVEVQQPKVSINTKDLLSEASTSYAGSIAERAHNVSLATETVNNILIAPDEVLSLNTALGPVTLATGYQIGYGIALNGTEMITIPSEGGGICQVATTLFHAAFWAGLEIEERWPHLYWIERYGRPPLGLKGLDATVDQSGVDLKIKNNTGNWILIKTRDDGLNIHFSIWGTNPHFDVKVSGPVISNVVAANPEPVRQIDPTLAEGRELWVEHAEDGFTSVIERWVSKDGKEIDHMIFTSRYRPSRNVLAVSKPKETPTPVPGPAGTFGPGADGTPQPGETPEATPVPSGSSEPAPTASQ